MDITPNDTNQQHDSMQHFEILRELGDCYCSTGDFERAKQYYERAAVLGPDEAAPYVGLGVVALQNNLIEDAVTAFHVACRLDAKCAKAYAGLGMAAQQKNDYRGAFDMYLKSLELDSENMIGLLGLFQTSCQMGSFEQVTHYLELYLDMHPGDTSVMYPLSALYMKDGKIKASQNILRDILVLDPNNTDAANLLEEIEHNLAQMQKI
jgi:tetratricopeptide (TPR) repeat protein